MIKNALTIFIALEALTFFIAALLHSGMEIPILYATFHEPRIIPAMDVSLPSAISRESYETLHKLVVSSSSERLKTNY